jgi:hypothetical protein
MENAHSIKDEAGAPGTGTAIVAPGSLPKRRATVTSEVLCRLLSGEHMTSLDAVFGASTTRLAAVVHYLAVRYGWTAIESQEKVAGCRDGRVAFVAEYSLPAASIAAALAAGADVWSVSVRSARAELRLNAAKASKFAQRVNAARAAGQPSPAQRSLFEGEGVPA